MKKPFNGKKGMFFTIIGILLVTLLIAKFSIDIDPKFSESINLESSKIISTNNFVVNLEDDIKKGLYISSFRALVTQLDYITENGVFVNNAEDAFEELIINGSLEGVQKSIMNGSTITDWYNNFKKKSANAEIIFIMNITDIEVKQVSPWKITTTINVDINVTDSKGLASWNLHKEINSDLNIVRFEDPVYTVKTYGRILKNIKKTENSKWDINNTKEMFLDGGYRASSTAPDYLSRLEGNLSGSQNGIESFVNVKEIFESGLNELVYNNSAIDYIYWTTTDSGDYKINGITNQGYPNFKIDNESSYRYNITNYRYN